MLQSDSVWFMLYAYLQFKETGSVMTRGMGLVSATDFQLSIITDLQSL